MMRWRIGFLLVMAMSLLSVPTVFAQEPTRHLELNPFIGAEMYTENSFEIGFPQSVNPIQARFRLDKTYRGGIRFNLHNSGHWGEELFYTFEPNEAHFIRETSPRQELDLRIQIHNIGVNALYYFSDDESAATRPFLTFGLGATIYRPTSETRAITNDPLRGNLPGFDQSNEFSFNYGAGVKHRFGDSFVGFRADARHFIGRHPSFSLARHSDDPNATVFPADGAIHNFEVSAGVVFYLGR